MGFINLIEEIRLQKNNKLNINELKITQTLQSNH